jgi:peptidoglycan DL-endopeptidase CwlO
VIVPAKRRPFLAGLALLAVLLLSAPAAAAPTLASKRAEATKVLSQIQALDASVSKAVDEYNAAAIRLDEIRDKQRDNRRHLEIARSSFGHAQDALQSRLLALYTSRETSALEILLGAENLDDLIARADAVGRVSDEDARIVGEIRKYRAEVKRREAKLAEMRAEQEEVVDELADRRAEIEAQLAERQRLLSSIKSEIARIEAEEARRQERLAAQARERLARASSSASSSSGSASSGGSSGASSDSGSGSGSVGDSEVAASNAPPARYGGVVGIAMQYLGIPYRWGGSSPSTGFDCSGFVMYVYAQIGVSLPHNAAMQYGYGTPVSRSALQPGDLVFFDGLGHDGIYIGGGQFIHSPHTGDVVKISSLSDSWYASTYVGARRL